MYPFAPIRTSAPAGTPPVAALPDLSTTVFLDAITAHVRWKQRLEDFLTGRGNNDLEYAVVCRDDCCLLGRWIYAYRPAFVCGSSTFEHLTASHARFHQCAGRVLKLAQSGHMAEAEDLLGGEYARLSRDVVATLVQLSYEFPPTDEASVLA